jgi:hypothetical protein
VDAIVIMRYSPQKILHAAIRRTSINIDRHYFDNTWLKQNEKGFKVIKLAEDKINPNDISTTESQALRFNQLFLNK